ncbi:MAG: hypothetical protein CMO26_09435 [Thiotrichales bacterium]|nr:hypothetical protein [Thiotrichales bacterium]
MQFGQVGALRLSLAVLGVCSLVFLFMDPEPGGLRIMAKQVVPALVVMVVWVLPFDALMAKVFMAERPVEQHSRYRAIIKFDFLVLAVLILSWGPYFYTVLTP